MIGHTPPWESALHQASEYARLGKNDAFLLAVDELIATDGMDQALSLRLASLLLGYGYPSRSLQCLEPHLKQTLTDRELLIAYAQAQLHLGNVEECKTTYERLLELYPRDLRVLQHLIFLSEYLPDASAKERLALAKRWGELAIELAGGPRPRPPLRKKNDGEPWRVGYVSADLCAHTVGLLFKSVLEHHDRSQFEIFTYSAGAQHDWVTQAIAKHSHFRDVRHLSDPLLAKQIDADGIDVLVDLSGHTGGSRLSVFAYRPAPIQLSWLGYYATTGLSTIDAVLLDRWHRYEGIEEDFVEDLIDLPSGRMCYYPAFPAPSPSPAPILKNGYVTFGSFNNTLKYNPDVIALWAKILLAVPKSQLILKWRTFNDEQFRKKILSDFERHGVESNRIELRGPSYHLKMLEEYGDIDIALDPFPFSGGLTSYEALYMGVPVITLPKKRLVSRQTYGYINQNEVNFEDLVGIDRDDYLNKAIQASFQESNLNFNRDNLRHKLLNLISTQIKLQTLDLETVYKSLIQPHR